MPCRRGRRVPVQPDPRRPVFYDLPTGPGTISATQISTRRLLDFSGKTIFADVTPARSDAGSGGLVNGLFLYRGASEGFYFQQEVDFEWVWGLRSSFEETDGALQLNVWNPDQNPVQISNKDFTAKGGDFFKRQTVQVQVQTDVVDFSIESDLPQHHGCSSPGTCSTETTRTAPCAPARRSSPRTCATASCRRSR